MNEPESKDKLAAARGIRNAILVVIPFWLVLCAGLVWLYG